MVWVRSAGARMLALGAGRDVRCGYWESAAESAEREAGGVMRWMSDRETGLNVEDL